MEFKDKGSIDLFFKRLAELIEEDIDIYLLGGCALILLGAQVMKQSKGFDNFVMIKIFP